MTQKAGEWQNLHPNEKEDEIYKKGSEICAIENEYVLSQLFMGF